MNISYFDTFLAILEHGSFSAAAKALNISQPAVSFQIQALERDLGATLLSRTGQKIELTSEGEKILVYARSMKALVSEMQTDLESMRSTITGPLVLSASTIPGEYLAPPLMAAFKAKYPQAKLLLSINDSEKTIELVESGSADIGFVGSLPKKKPKNIKTVVIATDKLVAVFPAGHALARKKTVSIASLVGEPIVVREHGSGTRQYFENALRTNDLGLADFNVVMELGSNQAVLSAVEAGLGFAVLSEMTVGRFTPSAAISDLALSRPLYLVYDETKTKSKAALAFVKLATE
jgi:DNA-binding transcriptional LysR family regulator